MVYTVEHDCSDRGADAVSDRVRPLEIRQRAADGERAEPDPAHVAGLLAQIGALGERIEATAQRSVEALRKARSEPDIETWDVAAAESLLELAAGIAARRQRLDDALEGDLARLSDAAAPSAEPGADAQSAMDPIGPGMI